MNLHVVGDGFSLSEHFLVSAWTKSGDGPEAAPARRFPLTLAGEKQARAAFNSLVAAKLAA